MPAPTAGDVREYLGWDPDEPESWEWPDEALSSAVAAERAAQAAVCSVPAEGEDWPADLAEALCRRVAANLAVRALPLGTQQSLSDFGVSVARVGGGDREVARLEAPYRQIPVA